MLLKHQLASLASEKQRIIILTSHMMQVARALIPLLNFRFDEEVRLAAVTGNGMSHQSSPSPSPRNSNRWFFHLQILNLPCHYFLSDWFMPYYLAMPLLLHSTIAAMEGRLHLPGFSASPIRELPHSIIPALAKALNRVTASLIAINIISRC